jgi:hypothetical protein
MTSYTNILGKLPKDLILLAASVLLWREYMEQALLLVPRYRVTVFTSM